MGAFGMAAAPGSANSVAGTRSVLIRVVSRSFAGSATAREQALPGTAEAVARRGRVVRATAGCHGRRDLDGVDGHGSRSRCATPCVTLGPGIRCRSSTRSRSCWRWRCRSSRGCAGGGSHRHAHRGIGRGVSVVDGHRGGPRARRTLAAGSRARLATGTRGGAGQHPRAGRCLPASGARRLVGCARPRRCGLVDPTTRSACAAGCGGGRGPR